MVAERARRLPGIRFEQVAGSGSESLPRMDVPVFVGFAANGPLDTPLPIDDPAGFRDTFGEDAVLAWDAAKGEPVRSFLGTCVRLFFANGGRRCWVIRLGIPADDWDNLGAGTFLDPALRDSGVESLLADADYVRYQTDRPRSLKGIHAALAVEEATLIAVPDAMHVASSLTQTPDVDEGEPGEEPEPATTVGFHACAGAPVGVPDLTVSRPAGDPHAIDLEWSQPDEAGTLTEIGERFGEAGSAFTTVYAGARGSLRLRGTRAGERWYRARYTRGHQAGAWSSVVHLPASGAAAIETALPASGHVAALAVGAARMGELIEIQRAVLAMCAARGDLFAVLALPGHLREDDTVTYMTRLRVGAGLASTLPPLPERAWSYGAVYHPWVVTAVLESRADVALAPPDGAICGVFARRAIGRGAWIAPANEALNGVVAVVPRLARPSWQALQDAQVNVIRHEPRGFLAFSADTLSDDEDYRPINVRRLLILLRRYAVARGMRHVFEPLSAAFRRRVQGDFEAMLGGLFTRGAFAGSSPRTSYQVVTDDTVNPAQGIDQGRFVVELRVAPSRPLRFLTVRLVHAPDRSLALVEA